MQNRVTSLTINKLQVWHAISNRNSNTRLRYMTNEFSINGAIAIYKGEEIFMTLSHFSLLKLIEKEGSINAAAKAKGIPYQHAWNLIFQMNKISPIPIVVRQQGGNGVGGCRSEEHTSELQSRIRIAYAVFCLTTTPPHIPSHRVITNPTLVRRHSV